jgi:hypothetical protein
VTSVAGFLLRAGIVVHAVASMAFWLAQPRGFEFLSRSFLEHQVVAPLLFAISAAGVAAVPFKQRKTEWIVVGILGGFWAVSASVIVVVGSTPFASAFWVALVGSISLLLLAYRRVRPDSPLLITGGTVVGLSLATVFWICSWAPPATTRPKGMTFQPSPVVPGPSGDIRIAVEGFHLDIESRSGKALFWPMFEYGSISDDGFWTLFQYRSSTPPPWKWRTVEDGSLSLIAENEDLHCLAKAWVENGRVHVRSETRVKREIASHLSTVMQLRLPGAASVEGVPWSFDHRHERSEFVAIRGGRTELLRAASREKGPFETLGSWPLQDPVLTIDGWKVQVQGWSDQGSRAPSPTAGWGVSQAAIERVGDVYLWSLASTSIGRGWHTVRTAPGVYILEAILTPP